MTHEEELEQQLEKTTALNKVLLDTGKYQAELAKHLRKIFVSTVICLTVIVVSMIIGFFWYENQFDYGTTTTTTTDTQMDTQGENANINNVTDGNMYNDNAVHNQN